MQLPFTPRVPPWQRFPSEWCGTKRRCTDRLGTPLTRVRSIRTHREMGWEIPVGVVASVSFIGALRFLGVHVVPIPLKIFANEGTPISAEEFFRNHIEGPV